MQTNLNRSLTIPPALCAVGRVYRNRDLRLVQEASTFNLTSEVAYLTALLVFSYEQLGATGVGIVGLVRVLPAAVVALVASVCVDRFRRERVLAAVEAARMVVAMGSAGAVLSGAPPAVIVALGSLLFAVAALCRPLELSLVPLLARTAEELTASNLARSLSLAAAWTLGPVVGAALMTVGGVELVFAAAGWGFLVASALSLRISPTRPTRACAQFRWTDMFEGVRAAAGSRDRLVLGSLFGAQAAVRGALQVLVVVASVELLGFGASGVGLLNASFGAASLVGALAALALVGRRRLAGPFGLGLLLSGAPIALVALWPNPWAALLLLGLPGLGNSLLNVSGFTMLQRLTPDRVLGRMFGALEFGFNAMMGMGCIMAAGLVAAVGVRGALLTAGLLLPVLAVSCRVWLRRADDAAEVPERELELVRFVALFEPLPAVSLEHVAPRAEAGPAGSGDADHHRGGGGGSLLPARRREGGGVARRRAGADPRRRRLVRRGGAVA